MLVPHRPPFFLFKPATTEGLVAENTREILRLKMTVFELSLRVFNDAFCDKFVNVFLSLHVKLRQSKTSLTYIQINTKACGDTQKSVALILLETLFVLSV